MASIPLDIKPAAITLPDGAVEIAWANDGHTSRYPLDWLYSHGHPGTHARTSRKVLWDAASFGDLRWAHFDQVREDLSALRDWLAEVDFHGFALLHGVPAEPGQVTRVVDLFGFVRETNYGRIFDVQSVADPTNLASTSLPLGAHSDNPYRDPTPTLQLLHCLSSSVEGGDNTLVDAFKVAADLREEAPDKFDLLSRQPVLFRYRDKHTDLSAEFPIITLNTLGEVTAVRFNQRSIAPFDLDDEVIEPYYEAYRTFALMLGSPRYQVRFKLQPGDLMLFDNLRIQHGRTGFSSAGSRHLQGCYSDVDGLRSKLAILSGEMDER
jgi:gamma-butyrobetaine dioxygenase